MLPASAATTAGVAFDQIDRVAPAGSPPDPDTFQADYDALSHAAVTQAQAPAPKKRGGLFGGLGAATSILGGAGGLLGAGGIGSMGSLGNIANLAQLASNPQALAANLFPAIAGGSPVGGMLQNLLLPEINGVLANALVQKPANTDGAASNTGTPAPAGTLRHIAIASNGWQRIDEPGGKTATIVKPELGTSYVLNLADHTYRVIGESAAATTPAKALPAGTASARFTVATRSLGPRTVANVPATGFNSETNVEFSGATGSCKNDRYTSVHTVYLSQYAQAKPNASATPSSANVVRGGCAPTATFSTTGPSIPTSRVYGIRTPYSITEVEKRPSSRSAVISNR